MTRRTPLLDAEAPESFVEIHPEDAEGIGVRDGDTVEVSSWRGKLKVKVRVVEGIRKGTVFLPFHFAEAAANLLTIDALDPVAKIPEYKVCAVKINKAQEG